MPGAVYPGLAAGQHSPVCLASGPVCCYKGHLCSWLNQLPHLEFLLAWWERVERRSCVAALPKYALTIHSLHQLLGWKDLEQSTFVKCQKIMSVGTRKGGSFTETSSYLAGRLYKSWDLRSGCIWGLFCFTCSRNRDAVESESDSPAQGLGETCRGFSPHPHSNITSSSL